VSRAKLAIPNLVIPNFVISNVIPNLILGCALLLSLIAGGAGSARAQTAAPATATPAATPADVRARVTERAVDATTPDDPAVDKMLEAYAPKVRALDLVIGKLVGDLKKGGAGAGSLGNFVTDGIRSRASLKLGRPVALAVTNNGGLRKSVIAEGDLRTRDIFELLPFENALVEFDLTGAQLLDLLRVVVQKGDAQSGARVVYRSNPEKKMELVSARLLVNGQEKEIDPAATYKVISIDYLLRVKGDYAVLQQASASKPLGLTIRDVMIDYVKAETAAGRDIKSTLDGRFHFDKPATVGVGEVRPQ
jgi:2',3'-cyclic-nucleotide 2'-phosphodiesterase (5'-nucleotidase family)